MKDKIRLTAVFFLTVTATFFIHVNIAKAQIVTDGLVSYWTFDKSDIDGETVKDVWGDNHGTIMGDSEIVEGKIGEALEFDGANDYILVPHSESLKPEKVTVSAWVYPNASGGNNIISSSGDHHPSRGYELHIGSGQQGYMTIGDGSNWNEIGFPGGTVTNGKWHHLAGVYDGEKASIYINGEQVAAEWKPMKLEYSSQDSGIGGQGAKFSGIIDEVCVYNRVLDGNEVKQNFAADDNSISSAITPTNNLAITWGEIKNSR